MSFLSLNQILTAALCGESPEEIDGLFPLRDSNSWRRILSLHMYLLADKYDMPDLQNHCVNRIETFLIKEGNTEWFWQSLDFIKETTVDTKLLKECLSSHLAHHLSRYVDDERFGQLIKDLPEVTWLAFKNVIDVIRMKDVLLGL